MYSRSAFSQFPILYFLQRLNPKIHSCTRRFVSNYAEFSTIIAKVRLSEDLDSEREALRIHKEFL